MKRFHPTSQLLNRLAILLGLRCLFVVVILQCGHLAAIAGTATLTVAADKPGHPISPTLYGIFFEDINCSADGGLYAEMVRNRNFEDSETPDHWAALSTEPGEVVMTVDSSQPISPKNLHSLKVQVN